MLVMGKATNGEHPKIVENNRIQQARICGLGREDASKSKDIKT